MSDGLVFSSSGTALPNHTGDIDQVRVSHNWFLADFNNGIVVYGRIDP